MFRNCHGSIASSSLEALRESTMKYKYCKTATVLTYQMTADHHSAASKGCVLNRWASAGRSHPEATELSLLTCGLQHSVTIVTVHT